MKIQWIRAIGLSMACLVNTLSGLPANHFCELREFTERAALPRSNPVDLEQEGFCKALEATRQPSRLAKQSVLSHCQQPTASRPVSLRRRAQSQARTETPKRQLHRIEVFIPSRDMRLVKLDYISSQAHRTSLLFRSKATGVSRARSFTKQPLFTGLAATQSVD